MLAELERLEFSATNRIFNPTPERGMFSSIQCAAQWNGWNQQITHWLITLGDQPHLKTETLQTLLDFGARHPEKICQPLRHGHARHPVLLPKEFFAALADSDVIDLKQFLKTHARDFAGFESDDAGLDLDMDTPEDYERLKP
ncbi:MAG: molybdenum cofactor cytidylyltransferase [Verrucomicrobiota bacterium]